MLKKPLTLALMALAYIGLVVLPIYYVPQFIEPVESVFVPFVMLSVFVFSVAVMGFFFLWQPIVLFTRGEQAAAVGFFIRTLVAFGASMLVAAGLLVLLVLAGILENRDQDAGSEDVACTAEVRICPDGTAVGRHGPSCEFEECTEVAGGDTGILPYRSGIYGTVSRGPLCPVVRVGEECPDAPYETTVLVFRETDTVRPIATTKSNASGEFEFSLPPGTYVVNARNDGIAPFCGEWLVVVEPDVKNEVSISCDTGIR